MIGRAARYACYACGYAANPCSYVSYAVTRVCAPHMRAREIVFFSLFFTLGQPVA